MANTAEDSGAARQSARQPGRRAAPVSALPQQQAGAAYPTVIVLFLISVMLPFNFEVGPVLLNSSRVFIMLMIAPAMIRWLSGAAGPHLRADYMILAFGGWMLICLVLNQGLSRAGAYWGSQFVEVVGAFFLARAFIVGPGCFLFLVRCYLLMVMAMLPVAFYENLTGEVIYLDLWRGIPGLLPFNSVEYGTRMGFYRAQVAFVHPILYGVVVSTAFSLAWLVLKVRGRSVATRVLASGTVAVATLGSMSAGPVVAVVGQAGLIFYDWVMRANAARWKIFFILVALTYVAIDLYSARSPFAAVLSRVTFSASTAFNRLRIWDYGTDEVMRNPIFGMGLFTDWIRPAFMPSSVDNHWLLMAMRYGLPGIALLLGAFLWIIYRITRKDFNDESLQTIGKGVVFSMVGVILSLSTVAAFSSTFSLMLFMLGAGAFLLRPEIGAAGAAVPDAPEARARGGGMARRAQARGQGTARASGGKDRADRQTPPPTARTGARTDAGADAQIDATAEARSATASRGRYTRFPKGTRPPGGDRAR